jgi:hypothetical protein
MLKTIVDCELGVALSLRTIHRLQKEVAKIKVLEAFRFCSLLGKDQFEFVTSVQSEVSPSFGADADPIDTERRRQSAVGFDRHGEAAIVQGGDESAVELQERFTTRADD